MHDPTDSAYAEVPAQRGIYCNRSLNLRSIEAIGYDMDYTLIHYEMAEWEGRAYAHTKRALAERGWPVEDLEFEHDRVIRGLVVDKELGNVVKANRFGYVKQAAHGTEMLGFGPTRDAYSRTLVDVSEDRWEFLNTLFSISAAWIYQQLVDLLDDDQLPAPLGYESLWDEVQTALDAAHLTGKLKSEIMDDPDRFVQLDPDMPLTLLDQKHAGQKLLLITNSGWDYTRTMMEYAVDPYLPGAMTWRELFDLSVVAANKPDFFSIDKPMFRLATEDGLVEPIPGGLSDDGVYLGGNAGQVEEHLGLSGDQILFVGDHIFSDVNISKSVMRWRTALVVRELEREIRALEYARDRQAAIRAKMDQKVEKEAEISRLRLQIQRNTTDYGPQNDQDPDELRERIDLLREEVDALNDSIGPLVDQDGREFNPYWGYLMRAGNDTSLMTRELERNADIYTSRVSNFLKYTPYVFFRAPRESLPHDTVPAGKLDPDQS